jgi:hypothetical protein
MQAFPFFRARHDQHLQHLNSAHIVLIPKKSDATCIADYRPINLTHSIAKLFSKCLARRLALELNDLISRGRVFSLKGEVFKTTFCTPKI